VDVLNAIAGVAAIILALELLIVVVLFAALCVGAWYGLRMGQRQVQPGFVKVNDYVAQGRAIERKALGIIAKPFIVAHSFGEIVGVTVTTVVARTREKT
jgi:hypothetical protein